MGINTLYDKKNANYSVLASDKTAQRVRTPTSYTKISITAEAISFSAGAAGTTGIVTLANTAVYDSTAGKLGSVGDTSFAWVTGTVLTTEVAYDQYLTDTAQLAAMANGEYAIDYDTGIIRYCKATTGTSDTCNYTIKAQRNDVNLEGVDVEIGAVEIKDSTSDDRVNVITQDAAFGTASKGLPLFGKYQVTPTTYSDNDAAPVLLDVNGRVVLSSDIEIGAVEIKDGDSDVRLDVITQDGAFGTATNGLGVFGKYQATPTTYSDNDAAPILLDANGRIVLSSDIQIGAVELKNGADDTRAIIKDGSTFATGDVALGVADANVLAGIAALHQAPAVTNATGSAAINTTTAVANHFKLSSVTVHFGAAPTTSQNFVVTLDANDGAAYDTVLFSRDPSATSATDMVFIPDTDLLFENGDEIVVTFTNTDTVTYGLRIVTQVI